ncbi:spore coat associated protein CotJA [Chengkuizengella marina]|uniref:Spore coat associated protein CotJA n=1 Tax=Chengkuizengella marina TaxID=2507566 RepID=A0A6N9PZ32_9BACL|nr:spore coat associated protein CotJA [Chengkuizengella marina]NBI28237.1 spore coat associated protein CotJA [Chengkuizengella marina]
MYTQTKRYYPYISPFDPCPPIRVKTYSTPPELYVGFQRMNMPQYNSNEALNRGTLWPIFYSPYPDIPSGYTNKYGENQKINNQSFE